jgi:hypothetical protein
MLQRHRISIVARQCDSGSRAALVEEWPKSRKRNFRLTSLCRKWKATVVQLFQANVIVIPNFTASQSYQLLEQFLGGMHFTHVTSVGLFTYYLTTLYHVLGLCRDKWDIMKNALEWMWEAAVLAYLKELSRYICLEQLRTIKKRMIKD